MTDDEALAWAYLSRVVEPPCAELAALVEEVGPVAAADRVKRRAVGDKLSSRTEARRDLDCAADDLDALARMGGRLLVPGTRTGRSWRSHRSSTSTCASGPRATHRWCCGR